ncbi:type II toxin-antitoxin system HicA family toxin [Methylobacterium nonmethylotrophicum]|uniref:Type II toxin-antitoxin system HicA family toxin n=1 Tax=Methylobacterium nonmethylotrophicum TaxID=1141884 RepID=A0A4Z0NJ76_9HYPH|nr:type II toxin-antitoxin system HicA family toxin [Methylobacterium nonmethylotrophicum]TGD95784.1 type II toxin-antitoxin system HicA family toxin [Methylobacterium nonmethylotrophicum]
MNDYTKPVKALLLAAGCVFKRQGKGNHEIWFSLLTNRAVTVDGAIKSRHTANGTLRACLTCLANLSHPQPHPEVSVD